LQNFCLKQLNKTDIYESKFKAINNIWEIGIVCLFEDIIAESREPNGVYDVCQQFVYEDIESGKDNYANA
jgi:hypothetical protein